MTPLSSTQVVPTTRRVHMHPLDPTPTKHASDPSTTHPSQPLAKHPFHTPTKHPSHTLTMHPSHTLTMHPSHPPTKHPSHPLAWHPSDFCTTPLKHTHPHLDPSPHSDPLTSSLNPIHPPRATTHPMPTHSSRSTILHSNPPSTHAYNSSRPISPRSNPLTTHTKPTHSSQPTALHSNPPISHPTYSSRPISHYSNPLTTAPYSNPPATHPSQPTAPHSTPPTTHPSQPTAPHSTPPTTHPSRPTAPHSTPPTSHPSRPTAPHSTPPTSTLKPTLALLLFTLVGVTSSLSPSSALFPSSRQQQHPPLTAGVAGRGEGSWWSLEEGQFYGLGRGDMADSEGRQGHEDETREREMEEETRGQWHDRKQMQGEVRGSENEQWHEEETTEREVKDSANRQWHDRKQMQGEVRDSENGQWKKVETEPTEGEVQDSETRQWHKAETTEGEMKASENGQWYEEADKQGDQTEETQGHIADGEARQLQEGERKRSIMNHSNSKQWRERKDKEANVEDSGNKKDDQHVELENSEIVKREKTVNLEDSHGHTKQDKHVAYSGNKKEDHVKLEYGGIGKREKQVNSEDSRHNKEDQHMVIQNSGNRETQVNLEDSEHKEEDLEDGGNVKKTKTVTLAVNEEWHRGSDQLGALGEQRGPGGTHTPGVSDLGEDSVGEEGGQQRRFVGRKEGEEHNRHMDVNATSATSTTPSTVLPQEGGGGGRRIIKTPRPLRSKRQTGRSGELVLYGPLWTDKRTLFVETVVVADWSFSQTYGTQRDTRTIRNRVLNITNIANAYLNQLGVVLVVTELKLWEHRIDVSINLELALNQIDNLRQRLLREEPNLPSDNIVLITGTDLNGDVTGRAFIKGMCREKKSASVVEDQPDAGAVGHSLAHELGHNLGMLHDGKYDDPLCATCHEGKRCNMAAVGSHIYDPSLEWSQCSRKALAKVLKKDTFNCLKNVPELRTSSCGDGVVDISQGEQCDCGPPEFCHTTCCDPHTCRLAPDASCATGACCDTNTCKPKAPGSICRAALADCDLPELCSGFSEACPDDFHKADGEACQSGKGHCYQGRCGSHEGRCQHVFGPTAVTASPVCYQHLNVKGNSDGNCGEHTTHDQYLHCTPENNPCGSLQCRPPATKTSRLTKEFHQVTTTVEHHRCTSVTGSPYYPQEYWLSPDGASCGHGKMCLSRRCVGIGVVGGEGSVCSAGCSGRGVCNNRGNCHCDPGFAPPDCSRKGLGGSIDSNAVSDMSDNHHGVRAAWVLAVLVVAILCVMCCVWGYIRSWWRRRGRACTTDILPCCATCLDACCCPVMNKTTRWLVTVGSSRRKNQTVRDVEDGEGVDEAMICSVDVDVKGVPETKTWGTANDKLVTDIITVTPKCSPDLRRKVMLPSNSPVLHRKSVNDLDRPTYMQSISVDSGCGSDTDEGNSSKRSSLHMSMTSLISSFRRFGSKPSKAQADNENRKSKQFGSQKSMPLSRFVVDPLAGSRNSRQGTPPPDHIRPAYNRSYSTDATLNYSVRVGRSPPPPPAATLKPNKSEENLLKTSAVSKNNFLQADKENTVSNGSIKQEHDKGKLESNRPVKFSLPKKGPLKTSPPRNVSPSENKADNVKTKVPLLPKKKPAEERAAESKMKPKVPPASGPNEAPRPPPGSKPQPPGSGPNNAPRPPPGMKPQPPGSGPNNAPRPPRGLKPQASGRNANPTTSNTQGKNVMGMARRFEGL